MKSPLYFWKLIYSVLIILIFLLGTTYYAYALGSVSSGFRINYGQVGLTVDAHGVCKKITNYSGSAIFIPTRSSSEWSTFRLRSPAGVSFTECRVPCGVDRYLYGTNCYYVGRGYYSPINNDNRYACTNKPGGNTQYTSAGNGSNNCNWEYEYYYYRCWPDSQQWQASSASVAGPGPVTFPNCPYITLGASCNFTSNTHDKCRTTTRANNGNPLYGICGYLNGTAMSSPPSATTPGLCSNGVVHKPWKSGSKIYWRCQHVNHSSGYVSCSSS